eukprot:1156539-Pelagomonas_calceolata.AAC.1
MAVLQQVRHLTPVVPHVLAVSSWHCDRHINDLQDEALQCYKCSLVTLYAKTEGDQKTSGRQAGRQAGIAGEAEEGMWAIKLSYKTLKLLINCFKQTYKQTKEAILNTA